MTAEIISHRRPIDWDILGRMTGTPAAKKLTIAQGKLADENLTRPIRVRGQLMFDASQPLCTANGQRSGNEPARRSGWEIHLVYAIDVCKATSMATCAMDDASRWKPPCASLSSRRLRKDFAAQNLRVSVACASWNLFGRPGQRSGDHSLVVKSGILTATCHESLRTDQRPFH